MNDYQVSCLGKAAFSSRRAARRRARQIRGEGGPDLRTGPHGPIHLTEYAQ